MTSSEQPQPPSKYRTIKFFGVVIILAVLLAGSAFLLNKRTMTPSAPVAPVVKPEVIEERGAPQVVDEARQSQETQSNLNTGEQPVAIPSAGPSGTTWLIAISIGATAYTIVEYLRSRRALARAALHTVAR